MEIILMRLWCEVRSEGDGESLHPLWAVSDAYSLVRGAEQVNGPVLQLVSSHLSSQQIRTVLDSKLLAMTAVEVFLWCSQL